MDSTLLTATYQEELYSVAPAPTIVVDQPWRSISDSEKLLLEKIVSALKQSLYSITIKYQASLDLASWVEKPKQIIYFGKPIKGIPLYEVVEANGVVIVASETLNDLAQNEDARKKLWQALKKQFSFQL